jgi:hypothetical protein
MKTLLMNRILVLAAIWQFSGNHAMAQGASPLSLRESASLLRGLVLEARLELHANVDESRPRLFLLAETDGLTT